MIPSGSRKRPKIKRPPLKTAVITMIATKTSRLQKRFLATGGIPPIKYFLASYFTLLERPFSPAGRGVRRLFYGASP